MRTRKTWSVTGIAMLALFAVAGQSLQGAEAGTADVTAKALSLAGGDTIPRDAGDPIPWKQQLIEKLVKLQKDDGTWANEDNQFWETDPVLVTGYSILTLQYAIRQ